MKCLHHLLILTAFSLTTIFTAEQSGGQGSLALPWGMSHAVNVMSKTRLDSAATETNVYLWRNARGKEVRNYCKIIVLSNENLIWLGSDSYTNFVVIGNRIIALTMEHGTQMFVNISTNRLSASTDVERTVQLQFFRQKFANPAIYDREIDLGKILGRFAFQVGGRAESSPPPEVKGITVTESAVGITLKGVNGAVAEIAFDSEMEPISAILNGKKVFPRK